MSHHHNAQHRRNDIRPRQVVRPTTSRRRPPVVRPTVTLRPPVATTVRPTVTQKPPIVQPTVTPKRPPVASSEPPPVVLPPPVSSPPVLSKPGVTVVPAITSATPSLPPPTITSNPATTTVQRLPSPTSNISVAASTTPAAPTASSGVSTGAVVGGIMGGFIALGVIAAAVFLYLRRVRAKKEGHAEAFDATKFRQSALMLEDSAEKRGKPRPPTGIEQHVRNTPAQSNDQYTHPEAARYVQGQARYGTAHGAQNAYGVPYTPGSYAPQTAYGQYPPPPIGAYGQRQYDPYGAYQGYPPQPQYPPQPHYPQQQYSYDHSAASPAQEQEPSPSGRDSLVLPNPYASLPSPASEVAPTHQLPGASSASVPATDQSAPSSTQRQTSTQDGDAPPAYETSSKFSNYKPDVKVKPIILTVISDAIAPTAAVSVSSTTATSPSAIPASKSPVMTVPPAPASSAVADKMSPSRPLSSHTVYNLDDVYGGM